MMTGLRLIAIVGLLALSGCNSPVVDARDRVKAIPNHHRVIKRRRPQEDLREIERKLNAIQTRIERLRQKIAGEDQEGN